MIAFIDYCMYPEINYDRNRHASWSNVAMMKRTSTLSTPRSSKWSEARESLQVHRIYPKTHYLLTYLLHIITLKCTYLLFSGWIQCVGWLNKRMMIIIIVVSGEIRWEKRLFRRNWVPQLRAFAGWLVGEAWGNFYFACYVWRIPLYRLGQRKNNIGIWQPNK